MVAMTDMPKKKTKASTPKSAAPGRRESVIGLKGLPEWKVWLARLAEHRRLSMADVIDQALVDYAAKYGFEPPPKR